MDTVAVFLKHPTPGRVKTRIAKDIGAVRAARIYSAMAEAVVETIAGQHPFHIFYDPPEKKNEIAQWLGFRENLIAQRGNSLGEKISNAIDDCLAGGSRKVVVIGTDCIELTSAIVKDSFKKLDEADAVIGPCEDCGYYLIGLKQNHTKIFEGIDWSTDKVMHQTLEKMEKLSLKTSLLEQLRDIDSVEDLSEDIMKKIN